MCAGGMEHRTDAPPRPQSSLLVRLLIVAGVIEFFQESLQVALNAVQFEKNGLHRSR